MTRPDAGTQAAREQRLSSALLQHSPTMRMAAAMGVSPFPSDRRYFRMRSEEEREAAQTATGIDARKAHQELARRHAQLAGGEEAHRSDAQPPFAAASLSRALQGTGTLHLATKLGVPPCYRVARSAPAAANDIGESQAPPRPAAPGGEVRRFRPLPSLRAGFSLSSRVQFGSGTGARDGSH